MNFPTAWQYLKRGTPVARAAWGGGGEGEESAPSKWLAFSGGALWINRADHRGLVVSGDLTEADLRAVDWILPKCLPETLSTKPDFPRTGPDAASTPLFNILSPPCKVR